MKLRFWKTTLTREIIMIPEGHKRIVTMADRFDSAINAMSSKREELLQEIADKNEELRQLDLGLKAMRAGLSTIADDPTVGPISSVIMRQKLDDAYFDGVESELTIDPYEVT